MLFIAKNPWNNTIELLFQEVDLCYREPMKNNGILTIGTSGWKYKHWNGVFYPAGMKEVDQLEYYTQHFNSVELNNSFYRQPTASNFENWRDAVPSNFKYAVKANRYFTHLKKLKASQTDLDHFLNLTAHLEDHLGPILFQLPPHWKINLERLETFLVMLPKGFRYTFEFRNQSWYGVDLYVLLQKYNCSFCIYELDGHLSPMEVTADFVYIRLHGPGAKYQGSYSERDLKKWYKLITDWSEQGKDVYLYFDNDQLGYAGFNAITLQRMIAKSQSEH